MSVAIDDFGTGYSSLNHLQRFQVDYLKIDQSFVRGIPGETEEARMTDAIMAIARTMGVKLIAEGIETAAAARLPEARAAASEGQGYLLQQAARRKRSSTRCCARSEVAAPRASRSACDAAERRGTDARRVLRARVRRSRR